MKARATNELKLKPGQALYALERLVDTRRVSAKEVHAIVDEMDTEISTLQARLNALRAKAGLSAAPSAGRRARRTGAVMSPEQAESRRIQGEYMGLLRHVKGAARNSIKRLALEQGREAAIRRMRKGA